MSLTNLQKLRQLCCITLLTLAPLATAQVTDLDMRLPMDIDADNTTIDGKNSMIIFNGLRLTQGQVSIQADEGRATRMELEDSYWNFKGNVVIDVGTGRIECDTAELLFDEFRLRQATVDGSPATYRLQRAGSDDETYAEAGRLKYDVDNGVIEFSEQATIIEGGNQISSNVLVYDIAKQRIDADSTGEQDGRVRITYTPANGVELPPGDEANVEDEPR
ncbi:MAG: lipopolysaccharide transport periplasmic protein LptA [Gammaproteobacteria bacterium]|nr:lipopolysaccharide transport periplasmic protein LptA [Gammaproteobacteria bacterium]